MIIDAHHHLWKVARGDYFWMDPRANPALAAIARDFLVEDYGALAAANGVGGSVLVQAAQTAAETAMAAGAGAREPWVDPRRRRLDRHGGRGCAREA